MTYRFSTLISLSMMMALAIFLSSALPAHATVENSLVPTMPSSVPFKKGKIEFQEEEGKIKLVIKEIDIPVGTPGNLVLSLMINDAAPEERQFPFVVKEDDGKPFNKIKLKVSLLDELGLSIGDVVKVLRTEVVISEEIVAVPGIVIEGKEDGEAGTDGPDMMETEPEPDTEEPQGGLTATGTYTFNAGILTTTTTASEFECALQVGIDVFTVPSITSTTMVLEEPDEESTTFMRASGTAGDIVGTWKVTDENLTLILAANGSFSLVGEDCDDE